uniref:glucan endo-1,3-beta-D-glucosidase n=1 Tax=Oryza punctata TaxID=4537 RepID=A0A0E0LX40_ORYPU
MSSSLAAALLAVAISCHCHVARGWGGLGVNYGTVADDLPTAARSVELLRAAGAGAVKIYDANADILRALAGTGMPVSVMVPNDAIPSLAAASPATAADEWVARNLAPHLPAARVVCLLVGNEVLSDRAIAGTTWPSLVPAMANLRRALCARGLGRVKVGTTLAMDALAASYPPSAGAFRDDIAGPVVRPLLDFLNATGSYYFVDAYPYFAWAANHRSISLDYALFQGAPSTRYVDPGTGLTYTNLFDQMLDAVVAAMARLGYGNVKLAVSETGWPTAGDIDELGANVHNAATYNRNLAARMAKNPGTPARPGAKMPVFLFSLYNENRKPGPGTERHWGLYYPNATWVYEVDLAGQRPAASYPPLPPASASDQEGTPVWCVLAAAGGGKAMNETAVAAAVEYACQQGSGTCAAIEAGGECNQPDTLAAHASYAFNAYWQQFRKAGHGSCKFISSLD